MNPIDLILKKRRGQRHTAEELRFIAQGAAQRTIPDYQLAAWLMAVCIRGLNEEETIHLTQAMADSGRRLDLGAVGPLVADKHSTGGVGDKVTLALGPLVAATGLPFVKMSGRGLGFTGGTIDKLEAIPGLRTQLSPEAFVRQGQQVGLVLASTSADLAPADGALYALRDVTGTVDSAPLVASSVMSKKLAGGANVLALDVTVGRGAFMKTVEQATDLARLMVRIAHSANIRACALVTSMDQPLGHAVGNALEVREALSLLRGQGPEDLLEVTLALGAELLLLAGRASSPAAARATLLEQAASGRAFERLRACVAAQGGDPACLDNPERLPTAPCQVGLSAPRRGYVADVDALVVAEVVVGLGGGRRHKGQAIDPAVGVVLRRKIGEPVEAGEPLATIHAADPASAERAATHLATAYRFANTAPPTVSSVECRVTSENGCRA